MKNKTFILCFCGLMTALTVLSKYLSLDIYFAGFLGIKVTFATAFVMMIVMFAGRWPGLWAIAAAGLGDALGFFIKPTGGGYLPWLTITAALGGALMWGLYQLIRSVKLSALRWTGITLLIAGVVNLLFIVLWPGTAYGAWLTGTSMAKRLPAVEVLPFVLGTVLLLGSQLLEPAMRKRPHLEQSARVWVCMTVAAIIVSLLNTWILIAMTGVPLTFAVFGVPRALEAVAVSTLCCTLTVIMAAALGRQRKAGV